MNEKNVPEEIVIKLPTQYAVDLSNYLMCLYDSSQCYPFSKLNDIIFDALDEQLYKVMAPEQHKRIQEILEKYGDEE